MSKIQNQLATQGLRSDLLDVQVTSKMTWKQSLSLPKGKDFNQAILKRAGISLEKDKGSKRQKNSDDDITMSVEEEENRDRDVSMEETNMEEEPNTVEEEVNMDEDTSTEQEAHTAEKANMGEENVEGQSEDREKSVAPPLSPDVEMGNDVTPQGQGKFI